ncbi:MAG TPA: flavin reductase family protein [Thermoplasmata archaeon]|nr:flavin reductase family protein [Thermoplasmata archaeon]
MSAAGVDPAAFRRLMGRWPTGVALVTAREASRNYGLTVNALLSVSLRPPTVLVSLSEDADTTPVVVRTGAFGVSYLGASQRTLSERFARAIAPEEKFRDVAFRTGSLGVPLLAEAIATLECRVTAVVPAGDHRLVLGEVVAQTLGPDGTPLVFHRGGYAEASEGGGLRLPPPPPASPRQP